MLKKIKDRLFLTGTSAGSLYPVVAVHKPSGLHLGVRLEVMKTNQPNVVVVGLYARLQKIDADGNPVPFSTVELFEAIPNSQLRIASATHMSGPLGQAPMPMAQDTMKGNAEACGMGVVKIVNALAKQAFPAMTIMPDAVIQEAAAERFLAVMTGDLGEDKIEAQLEAAPPSFDLGSLTDKFGPLPKPE